MIIKCNWLGCPVVAAACKCYVERIFTCGSQDASCTYISMITPRYDSYERKENEINHMKKRWSRWLTCKWVRYTPPSGNLSLWFTTCPAGNARTILYDIASTLFPPVRSSSLGKLCRKWRGDMDLRTSNPSKSGLKNQAGIYGLANKTTAMEGQST